MNEGGTWSAITPGGIGDPESAERTAATISPVEAPSAGSAR